MNKKLLANMNPKTLALLLATGILCACTKQDFQAPNQTEYSPNTRFSAITMDSLPQIPMPDSLPTAQTTIVNEHAFLTISWGVYGLIDPDSIQDVANNNHYTDVRIKTPALPENLATLLWLPREYHTIRGLLYQHIDNLESNDKRVRGMGKIYTACHDLPNDYEIHEGWNPCGMSMEDAEWFTENGWTVVDTSWYKSQNNIWVDTTSWNKENKTISWD